MDDTRIHCGHVPVMTREEVRRESRGARLVKRALDLVLCVPACIVLLPLLALTALAIKLDSAGPALFAQKRWGRDRVPFIMLKFRSLRHGESDPHARYEMLEADSRITRVGAFIRRTSIDELPQLFNVLRGSMSLVGPRPLPLSEQQQIRGWQRRRLSMKPGITGLWQVTSRFDQDFDGRATLDMNYIDNWSIRLDLAILFRTVPAVLRRPGQ